MINQEIISLLRNFLLVCCILFGLLFLNESAIAQVTSTSQLSDVKSDSWAFQALQTLVESYGCEAGYQDRKYRGDRATSRYEIASTLNACLDRVNEILAVSNSLIMLNMDEDSQERLQEIPILLGRGLKYQQRRLEQLENKLKLLEAK